MDTTFMTRRRSNDEWSPSGVITDVNVNFSFNQKAEEIGMSTWTGPVYQWSARVIGFVQKSEIIIVKNQLKLVGKILFDFYLGSSWTKAWICRKSPLYANWKIEVSPVLLGFILIWFLSFHGFHEFFFKNAKSFENSEFLFLSVEGSVAKNFGQFSPLFRYNL